MKLIELVYRRPEELKHLNEMFQKTLAEVVDSSNDFVRLMDDQGLFMN